METDRVTACLPFPLPLGRPAPLRWPPWFWVVILSEAQASFFALGKGDDECRSYVRDGRSILATLHMLWHILQVRECWRGLYLL